MFTKQFARSIESAVTSKPQTEFEICDIENNHYWRRLLLYSYVSQRGFVADQIIVQLKTLIGLEPELDYIYSKEKYYVKKALNWLEFFGFIKQRRFKKPILVSEKMAQDTYELIMKYEEIMMKNLINSKWVDYDPLTGAIIISGKKRMLQLDSVNKKFMDHLWNNQNQKLKKSEIKKAINFSGTKYAPSKYIEELGIKKFVTKPTSGEIIFKAPAPQNFDLSKRKFPILDSAVTK